MKEVSVPDIGDFKEVEVIEVLVKPGDAVTAEQSLITVESDKATMEIPAPGAGVVKELRVKVGDKVSQGSAILVLDEAVGGAAKAQAPKSVPAPAASAASAAPTPKAASAGEGSTTVKVPDIGDFKEVEVIEVLVKAGDAVTAEQSLITVESDKATMEIPAPGAGVVKELRVKVGDKVSQGSAILVLEGSGAAAPAPTAAEPAAAPEAAAPLRPPVPLEPQEALASKPHASPSVRKFARELGVDLSQVQGSGPKGRILHTDVQMFVKGALSG
ncbi:MAG: biotin/lipoyl-containing protein, partial [Burkholderiales bacterium]